MKYDYPYSCMETCGQEKPCGNRYCSAHPKHHQIKKNVPVAKNPEKK